MSLSKHVWDLVDWRPAHDPRPTASKEELWLRIQAILNYFPQKGIQNLFHSMPRRIVALIAALDTPNTDFEHFFFALKISSNSLYIKFHFILMIPSWYCISLLTAV